MDKLKIKMPLGTRIGSYLIMPWILLFYGVGGILGLIMMLKDKTKLKVNRHYLRLMIGSWVIFGISWVMPLRIMLLAKTVEYYLIRTSLLNIHLNIGDIIELDAKGVRLFVTVFGKGFEYSRYIHCYPNGIKCKYIKRFNWLK